MPQSSNDRTEQAIATIKLKETERCDTGLAFEGYELAEAKRLSDPWSFDPDFLVCGGSECSRRFVRIGRPKLRHTLNSLILLGDEFWLESRDRSARTSSSASTRPFRSSSTSPHEAQIPCLCPDRLP